MLTAGGEVEDFGAASNIGSPTVSGARNFRLAREIRRHTALAWFLAWSDTQARYRRSVLGPFWLVLGTLVGVVGLGVVWSNLTHTDGATLIPSLTVGLVAWNLVASSITSASSVFIRNASSIRNIPTPAIRLSLELLFYQLINFLHNMIAVFVVWIIYPPHLGVVTLLAIPGLMLVLVNLLWIITIVGLLGARFRDVEPSIAALMPILFFLTPVLYRLEQLGPMESVVQFNPLYYWIEIIRDPLQGAFPSAATWFFAAGMAALGSAFTFWIVRRTAHRLPYWV